MNELKDNDMVTISKKTYRLMCAALIFNIVVGCISIVLHLL